MEARERVWGHKCLVKSRTHGRVIMVVAVEGKRLSYGSHSLVK